MKIFAVIYNASINVQEKKDTAKRPVASVGADEIATVLERAITHGIYYLGVGYERVEVEIEAVCAACAGSGEVPKKRSRVLFAKKPCGACRGAKPPQPFTKPIPVSVGDVRGLRVALE